MTGRLHCDDGALAGEAFEPLDRESVRPGITRSMRGETVTGHVSSCLAGRLA